MSLILMAQAMKMKVGNPLRKLVLIKLADNANDKGECWPSHSHIADHCEISTRSVRTHIKALEEANFLTVINRVKDNKKQSNIYRLHFDKATISTEGDSLPSTAGDSLPSTAGDSLPTQFSTAGDSAGTAGDSLPSTAGDSYRTSHSLEPVNEPINNNTVGHPVIESAKQKDAELFNTYRPAGTTAEPITPAWKPAGDIVQLIMQSGVPFDFIQSQVAGFTAYWIAENRKPRANTWDSAFLQSVNRNWVRYQNDMAVRDQGQSSSGWSHGVEREVVL